MCKLVGQKLQSCKYNRWIRSRTFDWRRSQSKGGEESEGVEFFVMSSILESLSLLYTDFEPVVLNVSLTILSSGFTLRLRMGSNRACSPDLWIGDTSARTIQSGAERSKSTPARALPKRTLIESLSGRGQGQMIGGCGDAPELIRTSYTDFSPWPRHTIPKPPDNDGVPGKRISKISNPFVTTIRGICEAW